MKKKEEEFQIHRGAAYFRHRLILATLTGTKIKIQDIRAEDTNPGLREFEASFLKLLQKIVDGSWAKINKTGTKVKYRPGIISNNYGTPFDHECHTSRSISYYLEGILPLILFGKEPANMQIIYIINNKIIVLKKITIEKVTLIGATNGLDDASIDSFRTIVPGLLTQFGVEETLILNTLERGMPPNGGGKVSVKCPIVKKLETINLTEEGKVKRVRGVEEFIKVEQYNDITSVAYACKTSPQLCNRIVDTMRGVFVDYLPDVWIHTDHSKAGLSGGYGVASVAETTTGTFFTADSIYKAGGEFTPESLGKENALRLLDEILMGGCVDSSFQSLALFLMALGSNKHVSSLKIGKLTGYSVGLLRLLYQVLKVKFKIEDVEDDAYSEEEEESDSSMPVIVSCVGVDIKNMARSFLQLICAILLSF